MLHKKNDKDSANQPDKVSETKNGKDAQPVGTVEISREELAELRKKAADRDACNDKWLRAHADFENVRKRMEKERSEHIKFANEDIIVELIGILDNFERGLKAAEQKKDFELLHQGVDMILNQLHKLLEERGLKRIKSSGEKFDPFKHEALEVVEGEPGMEGKITDELQAGYELNGRVIRPAKVRVVKNKKEE